MSYREDAEKCRMAMQRFDIEHHTTDIILLGRDGAVRRIMLESDWGVWNNGAD